MTEDVSVASDSSVFHSVWKGEDRLAGPQGQLQMREYTRMLGNMSWRELGLLLVRLSRALDSETPTDTDTRRYRPWLRCLWALAGTIEHMQTADITAGGTVVPVNREFVSTVVVSMLRATQVVRKRLPSAFASAVYLVMRAVACIMSAQTPADDQPPRFAADAVIRGLLGAEIKPEASAKRRRAADGRAEAELPEPQDRAAFLRILADALDSTACGSAHRYILKALRAQDGALVASAAGRAHQNTDFGSELTRLARVLLDRGSEVLDPKSEAGEVYIGDLFACVRDVVPLACVEKTVASAEPVPLIVESATKLARALTAVFRPHALAQDSVSLYRFCAEKRHRCYQWAALCQIGTWMASQCGHDARTAEPLAECSRLCWLQILDVVSEADDSIYQVWYLLLGDSLRHIALDCHPLTWPANTSVCRPLFMECGDVHAHVFVALAQLLTRVVHTLPALAEQRIMRALALKCLRLCDKLLRAIRPPNAPMRLHRPSNCALEPASLGDDAFGRLGCTPVEYVFCPPYKTARETTLNGESLDPAAERKMEDSDEVDRETQLARVISAFVMLTENVTSSSSNAEAAGSGMPSVLAMTFGVMLRWIDTFTTSARDSAGRQARQFESLQRVNIGLVGDKTRLVRMATDWTRLQRIPLVRSPDSDDNMDGGSRSTFKSAAAQTLRLLATIPMSAVLGDRCRPILERCIVWSDDADSNNVANAGAACLFSANLKRLLSERDYKYAALSALRILSGVFGVRSHWFAGDVWRLRLPNVQVRSHSPASSEALMQLAMQVGLCRLLLDPELLVFCVARVRSGELLRSSLALCGLQIWLDMIGNVVRHSLFRSYAGLSHVSQANSSAVSAADGQHLPFTLWWSLALALSTRCMVDMLDAGGSDVDMARIRLACILPSHLMSWYTYLPISESTVRGFVAGKYGGFADVELGEFKSTIQVLYFLACRLWTAVPALDQTSDATNSIAMYICRDVWGIASDALHLLRRLTQYPVVRGMLATPGLVESLGGIVPGIVDGSGAPQLIRNLTRTQTVLSFADLMDDAEDEPDLLPFPLFGIDESGEVGSDKSSQETDVIAAAIDLEDDNDGAGSENEDVVDKLLFESAQLRRPRQRQRALGDYYSVGILTPLWRIFVDELLELPAFIAFGPTPVNTPGEAEVLERLADRDNVLFDLLRPLLAARGSLAGTNTLWKSVAAAVPLDVIARALRLGAPDAVPRMCVSAALVLPELTTAAGHSKEAQDTVSTIVRSLVQGVAHDSNGEGGRCVMALLFLAWRQRRMLVRQFDAAAVFLQEAANQVLELVGADRGLLVARGCSVVGGRIYASASADNDDLVMLSGNGPTDGSGQTVGDGGPPIITSMQFLVKHSSVFRVMFTGAFAEAQEVQRGGRHYQLQSDHTILAALFAILHRCAFVPHYSHAIDSEVTIEMAVRILELAIYYDVRPVIVCLAWYVCSNVGKDGVTLSNDDLDRLAVMYSEGWGQYLPTTDAKRAVNRMLAAILLLHLDTVDVVGAVGPDIEPFSAVATRLFQNPIDPRACR